MKKINHKKFFINIILATLLLTVFNVASVSAQVSDGFALTITPPLIKINMNPGESWSSFVKIVNTNPYPITVYASVRDFRSKDGKNVDFIKKEEITEGQSFLLSHWLEVSQDPIEVSVQQSVEVPFTIRTPVDAEPGGHYAAVLIGTKPLVGGQGGSFISVSSLVASLIMLNVQGDIAEEGRIREFSTEKGFYEKPEVDFSVVFENTGNIHLQPKGEIKIYNFLGKERGTISINQKTHFGNVLPQSARKWTFEWKGERGFSEMGKYKAELVLVYGEEAHTTIVRTLYFWVIPIKPALGILGGLVLLIFLVILGLRSYIKRAINIAQKEAGLDAPAQIKLKPKDLTGPLTEAVVDLREAAFLNKKAKPENSIKPFPWKKYFNIIICISAFIILIVAAIFYFQDLLQKEKSFEIIISEQGGREHIIPNK